MVGEFLFQFPPFFNMLNGLLFMDMLNGMDLCLWIDLKDFMLSIERFGMNSLPFLPIQPFFEMLHNFVRFQI